MKAILAFPVFVSKPEVIVHAPNTAAMDWFVIATLCFFFFLLGCFATAAWHLWKRTTRPDPHVRLLMELADSDEDQVIQNSDGAPPKSPDCAAWEKPSDWWKNKP